MDYFRISLWKSITRPISFSFLPDDDSMKTMSKLPFSQLEPLKVGFFDPNEKEELSDILTEPRLMFSDKIKGVLEDFFKSEEQLKKYLMIMEAEAEGIENFSLPVPVATVSSFKCIQLLPHNQSTESVPRYWILDVPEVDCLQDSTLFYPNGMLKKLVLDREKIPENPCFKVGQLLETRIIVSLDLAEKILQKNPFGIYFEKVEVK